MTGTGNRLDASPTDAGENTGRLSVTLKPGTGPERGTGRDRRAARQVRRARGRAVPVQPPGTVHLRLAARSDDHRIRPRPPARSRRSRSASACRRARLSATSSRRSSPAIPRSRSCSTRNARPSSASRCASSPIAWCRRVRGNVATRYKLREKKIDVLVRSVDTRASSVEEIRSLIVNPGSDRPLPLSAVAEVTVATGPAEIRRTRQQRVAIVTANLSGGDLGSAVAELEAHRRGCRTAGRHDGRGQRPERRHERVVRLAPVHDAARRVSGLPGDGIAVRIAAAPVRDPADHPAGADRLGLGDVPDRHHGQRGRLHRPDHAGGHRRQPVDRADRRGQSGARDAACRSTKRSSRPRACACGRSSSPS